MDDFFANKTEEERMNFFKKVSYFLRNEGGSVYYPASNVWNDSFNFKDLQKAWKKVAQDIREGNNDRIGLYMHTPFCKSKCFYCTCQSFTQHDEKVYDHYLDCVEKEIEKIDFPKDVSLKTVYLGGGTPSIYTNSQLIRLMKMIHDNYNLSECRQIMVEVSPYTTSFKKFKTLKKYGVNKITIGVQTMDEGLLKKMNRPQTKKGVVRSYNNARKAGIEYINIDLMAGLPGQTKKGLIQSVNEIIDLKPDTIHINPFFPSVFTPYTKSGMKMSEEDLKKRRRLVNIAHQLIKKKYPYAMEKGDEQKENIQLYNTSRESCSVIGIGAEALSHARNQMHYLKKAGYDQYINILSDKKIEIKGYKLNKEIEMRGMMIKRLEKDSKIDINNFKKIFNENPLKVFNKEIEELKRINKIKVYRDRIKLITERKIEPFLYAKFFYTPDILKKFDEIIDDVDDLDFKLATFYESD